MVAFLRILVVLLACAYHAQGANIVYKYQYGLPLNLSFSDPLAWVGSRAPENGDDVQIIGDTTGNAFTGITQFIDLGTANLELNSLNISANDIQLSIGGVLTIGDFSSTNWAHVQGNAPGATIIVTSSFYLAAPIAVNNAYNSIILNISTNANVTYFRAQSLQAPNSVFNNLGEWHFIQGNTLDSTGSSLSVASQTFVFNNWGLLFFDSDGTSTAITNFYAKSVSNWGQMYISANSYVRFAQPQSSNVNTYFTNYGQLNLDGTIEINDGSQGTLTSAATFLDGYTNSGTFYLVSYSNQAILHIDATFNFPNGKFQMDGGPARIEGAGSISVGSVNLTTGGIIAGSSSFTVVNFVVDSTSNGITSTRSSLLRNVTVTGSLSQDDNLNFGNGAFVNIAAGCVATMSYGQYTQLSGDSSQVGLVNWGTINAALGQPGNTWQNNLPTQNYGTITVPQFTTDVTVSGPSHLNFFGGSYTGSLTMFNRTDTNLATFNDDNDEGYFVISGPDVTMTSSVTLYGGQFSFRTSGTDFTFVIPGSWHDGAITWQARSSSIGDGVIFTREGVHMYFQSPTTLARNIIGGGSYEGSNITVNLARRVNSNGDYIWQLNQTSYIVDSGNLTMLTSGDVKLVGDAKLVINSNSNLFVGTALNVVHDSGAVTADAGLYLYGNAVFAVTPTSGGSITGWNLFNYGSISMNTSNPAKTDLNGVELDIKSATFLQYGSGSITLNVYAVGDSDSISVFPESNICFFSGTLNFNFKFAPQEGSQYLVLKSQGFIQDGPQANRPTNFQYLSQFSCGGQFTVTTTGSALPASTKAVMLYDYKATDGSQSVYHYLYICGSSNSTCTNYHRNPDYANKDLPSGFTPVPADNASSRIVFAPVMMLLFSAILFVLV